MAYVTNSELRVAPISGSLFATLIGAFREALRQRRVYKQTVTELSQLSSRELADLAIARCEINRIALDAAVGKSSR